MKEKLLIILFAFFSIQVFGQTTYYSVASGDWNNSATWSTISCAGAGGSGVPGATDDVVICNGIIVDILNSGTPTWNNLTMSGGTLMWLSNKTVTVNGNFIANGGDTSTLVINGGGANPNRKIIVSGICNVDAGSTLSVGGTTWTQSGATTIDGTLQFTVNSSGNKTFNSSITISPTGTFNNAIGETPTINGNIANNGNWIGCTGGTCTYTMGAVAGTYFISGNTVSMSFLSIGNAATTINNNGILALDGVGPDILSGNGIFNNTATGTLYLGCSGSNVGTITFNASTPGNNVYYNYFGNQTIATPSDGGYSGLICINSGTKSMAGNFSVGSLLNIQNAAIVNVALNTLNGTGDLTMLDNSKLQIAKCDPALVPELTGTYTFTGGTITLNGTCNQTYNSIPTGSQTVNNITLSGSGIKNICGITTINGNLNFSGSATISVCATYFTQSCSGDFNYSSTGTTTLGANISLGNFSQTAGTFDDGGFNITVCGSSFARSAGTFTASGTVTFNGSTTVSGAAITTFNNVVINPSKILIGHTTNMNVNADWTNNGTFTHNNSTVTFSGTSNALGTSITTFNNLTINGTLFGHSVNMNIEGNWTNNSVFTHNNGKVTFTGGNAQSIAGTAATIFYNVEVNKTAGTTLTQTAATTTVSNLLTMTEGIFNAGTNTLNGAGGFTAVSGDLQIAKLTTVPELTGTYSVTGGTVTLNGAGTQTLNTAPAGASTYYNLVFSTSGTKTITGLLTINGDVTVSGTATITVNSAFIQASP